MVGNSKRYILGYKSSSPPFQFDVSLKVSAIAPLWWMHLCSSHRGKRGKMAIFSVSQNNTVVVGRDYNMNHVTAKGCHKCVEIGLRPWLRSSTIESRLITLKCVCASERKGRKGKQYNYKFKKINIHCNRREKKGNNYSAFNT